MIPLRVICLGALADPRPANNHPHIAHKLKSVVQFTLGCNNHALLGLEMKSAAVLGYCA